MGKSTPSIPIATRAFDQRGGLQLPNNPSKSPEVISEVTRQRHTSIQNRSKVGLEKVVRYLSTSTPFN
ncbi:hypothetical protein CEXT_650501 [Caerostris extrusa]|uniref:Uncharacterized protein n=1 Tax=Caerostris extrusa TaxID=172846 RepID=A0AAV4MXI3_CAEEX|nr:hypothetical protein CEXT_650501 [Caerostris extrusa]